MPVVTETNRRRPTGEGDTRRIEAELIGPRAASLLEHNRWGRRRVLEPTMEHAQ